MNELNCEYVRDVYPDVLNGKLETIHAQQVRAHVASCDDCRAETAVLELIHGEQLVAPAGLDARVLTALARPQTTRRVPRHALALAASVAIALVGGSVLLQTREAPEQPAAELGIGVLSVDDAMLTGKASLDDFSEAELEMLLKEMES